MFYAPRRELPAGSFLSSAASEQSLAKRLWLFAVQIALEGGEDDAKKQ